VTIELALTPDSSWEIGAPALVEAAQQAGFAAVGLLATQAGKDGATALGRFGIRCHELLALVLTDDERITLSSAERLAAAAAEVGAQWVLTVFRTALDGPTARLVRRCAGLFRDAGSKMAVEFSPLGPVNTIPAGLEIVGAAGPERAALMIDSWHFFVGESTWEDLALVPLEQIAYVQFADALAPLSDNRALETTERRTMPGEGILELDRFASTLLERGWEGTVSVEVLSRSLRGLPVPEFARRARSAAARYWV
jgi:sugar phosphate isomerase/epimerase